MKKGIKELFIDELEDMLSAEDQIVKALPAMVLAAQSATLKDAFRSHLKETKGQVLRLKKVFKIIGVKSKEKLCKAAQGLIRECKDAIREFEKSPVRDAALISKAQRIEHYEISAYGTLRTFAKELSHSDAMRLLQETLDEEARADKKLTKIAEGGLLKAGINHIANLSVAKTAGKRSASKEKSAVSSAVSLIRKTANKMVPTSVKKAAKKIIPSSHKKTAKKAVLSSHTKPTKRIVYSAAHRKVVRKSAKSHAKKAHARIH